MTTNTSTNAPLIGQPMDRTDGLLKVTGEARYAAEFPEARIAHAVLVTSTISSGSIASIDASRAQSLPGVLLVMTYQNAPRLPNGGRPPLAPPAGRHLSLLQDNQIHYSNEHRLSGHARRARLHQRQGECARADQSAGPPDRHAARRLRCGAGKRNRARRCGLYDAG
jgi:CO/xanthine dehydrogenase Mo-binding subunit